MANADGRQFEVEGSRDFGGPQLWGDGQTKQIARRWPRMGFERLSPSRPGLAGPKEFDSWCNKRTGMIRDEYLVSFSFRREFSCK